MGKNKSKSNQQQYLKTDIDYDKLADTIVRANEIYAEKARQKEIESQKESHDERMRSLHLDAKEQPKKFIQLLWFIIRLPFIKRDDILDDKATFSLYKTIVCEILRLFQIAFAIIGIISFVGVLNCFNFGTWTYYNLIFIAILFLSWVMFGLFRMSAIEIDKMQDRQMVLSIISAITSFIAMVVAIVALFV